MPQVRIDLDEDLFTVLKQYAEEEIRDASGQATWLVRTALRERMDKLRYTAQYTPALQHEDAPLLPVPTREEPF